MLPGSPQREAFPRKAPEPVCFSSGGCRSLGPPGFDGLIDCNGEREKRDWSCYGGNDGNLVIKLASITEFVGTHSNSPLL